MNYLHTMVRVRNLEASLKFYCDGLGLKESRRVDNEKGRFTLIFLSAPNDHGPEVELTYNWDPEDYGIGRAFGLPSRLAILVAAGNAICGNSAIAAIAPVIGAEREHVASAIAFTAILGVAVVLGLPHLMGPLGFSEYQYGVLAGLSVYAVPQVLAAAFPVGALAGQVGTLVKLVRVLMLGPVVLFFTLTHRAPAPHADAAVMGARDGRRAFPLARALPWFIIGFLVMAALRSGGMIPVNAASQLKTLSSWLTLLAMAALGLGVDLRALRKVGISVVLTVTVSLVVLLAMSIALIRLLAIDAT